MKRILVMTVTFLIATFFFIVIDCQVVQAAGMIKVTDATNGNPIAGAQVIVTCLGPVIGCLGREIARGTTNANGDFAFPDSPFELAGFTVDKSGYRGVGGVVKFSFTAAVVMYPNVYCGDYVCTPTVEDLNNCPKDCSRCSDGVCTTPPEDIFNCSADCNKCGNAICDVGESPVSCPRDCPICNSNVICEPARGETAANCPVDCHCGNGRCDYGETIKTCSKDCGTVPAVN